MSINRELYSPPEPVEFEPEYTGFPEPVYSLPLETGWESPVTFEPYVPPTLEIQPLQTPQVVNQTNITEVTKVVETIYKEADFEPLPPMEFQAAVPETYSTMGYFGILLAILTLGLVPLDQEML